MLSPSSAAPASATSRGEPPAAAHRQLQAGSGDRGGRHERGCQRGRAARTGQPGLQVTVSKGRGLVTVHPTSKICLWPPLAWAQMDFSFRAAPVAACRMLCMQFAGSSGSKSALGHCAASVWSVQGQGGCRQQEMLAIPICEEAAANMPKSPLPDFHHLLLEGSVLHVPEQACSCTPAESASMPSMAAAPARSMRPTSSRGSARACTCTQTTSPTSSSWTWADCFPRTGAQVCGK